MGELRRRYGPQLPYDEAAEREHEVEEDLRRDHEANRVSKAGHKRSWWKFWARRSG